jgi:hypothetical protein
VFISSSVLSLNIHVLFLACVKILSLASFIHLSTTSFISGANNPAGESFSIVLITAGDHLANFNNVLGNVCSNFQDS